MNQKRFVTMYKKHKWLSGLRNFRAFIQVRQIYDLTGYFITINLCQNANLAQCKLTGISFEITYVSYTERCMPLEKRKATARSSTLPSSFLCLQRAFTPRLNTNKKTREQESSGL